MSERGECQGEKGAVYERAMPALKWENERAA
jgi:hypothetical protein